MSVLDSVLGTWDESWFRDLNLAGTNAVLDVLMVALSTLALSYVVAVVAIPLWWRGHRELAVDVLVLLLVTVVVTEAIKLAVARPRPCESLLNAAVLWPEGCPGSLDSFPSGHTSRVFALATLLFARVRKPIGATAFVGAALVGLSRIYLGVHWPTDVVGGAVTGLGVGIAFVVIARRLDAYRRVRARVVRIIARATARGATR